MSHESEFEQPPPSQRGSGSVLLWILGIAALCLVLCCGAAGVAVWRFGETAKTFMANMSTNDPEEIRKRTAEMVDIDIPDKYRPLQAVNMVAFQLAVYQADPAPDGASGTLTLMEMTMGAGQEQQEEELRKSMQQQGAGQQFDVTKSETRQIEIGGETIPFEFSEATQGEQKKFHTVSGVFPGKRGTVMLQLVIPADEYDEAAVLQMLQSINSTQ
jgi:hypothetical protein